MQIRRQSISDRRQHVQVRDENGVWRERGVVTVIPNRATVERYIANSPVPHVHRHVLRIVTGAPETATAIESRALTMVAEIMLFFFSMAVTGFFLGALLGWGFIPGDMVPVLLFLTAVLLLFILGVVLASLLFMPTQDAQKRSDQTPLREIVIPDRGEQILRAGR